MSFKVSDNTGDNYGLKIDSDNRAATRNISLTTQNEAAINGEAFVYGSGTITLTDTVATAVILVQNDACRDMLVTGINITVGNSTGAACACIVGGVLFTLYKNSTAIACCNGVANIFNNNFGSSNVFCVTSAKGAVGATLTGGCSIFGGYFSQNDFTEVETSLIIPKGKSIALTVTAPTGNTSVPTGVGFEVTYLKSNLVN